MSRNKRIKGYWLKKQEKYKEGSKAQERAGTLRLCEHVSHVKVSKEDDEYYVSYSVAKWYWEELIKNNMTL